MYKRQGFDRADLDRTAALARASGLDCCCFFLLGAPGENWETVEETLAFIERELTSRRFFTCLLYTSDAADDLLCVDLGGRRIIKKKKKYNIT